MEPSNHHHQLGPPQHQQPKSEYHDDKDDNNNNNRKSTSGIRSATPTYDNDNESNKQQSNSQPQQLLKLHQPDSSILTKSPEQTLAEHPVRQRLALQERKAQKTSNQKLRDVFKRVVWSTCNAVMKLRNNRKGSLAGNAGSSNNNNKNGNQLPGEAELERIIQWAEYEIHHDPYRGMTLKFAPSLSLTTNTKPHHHYNNQYRNHHHPTAAATSTTSTSALASANASVGASTTASSNGSTATTNSTTTTSNCTTPWSHCQWGSCSAATGGAAVAVAATSVKHNTTTSMVISSSSTSTTFDHSNHEDPEQLVRQICHCNCPSLVAWTTRRIKTSNTISGKKRGRTAGAASKQQHDEDPQQEEELEVTRWIQVSGRQALSQSSLSASTSSSSQSKVQRSLDENYRCICDYNPFCLGSLGGTINDILVDRSKEVAQTVLEARRQHRRILGEGINETNAIAIAIPGGDGGGNSSSSSSSCSSSTSQQISELVSAVSLSQKKKSQPLTPTTCNNSHTTATATDTVIDLQDDDEDKKKNEEDPHQSTSNTVPPSHEPSGTTPLPLSSSEKGGGVKEEEEELDAEEQAEMELCDVTEKEKEASDQLDERDKEARAVKRLRTAMTADNSGTNTVVAVKDVVVLGAIEPSVTIVSSTNLKQQQSQQGDDEGGLLLGDSSKENKNTNTNGMEHDEVQIAKVVKGRRHKKGGVSFPSGASTVGSNVNSNVNDEIFAFLGGDAEDNATSTTTTAVATITTSSTTKVGNKRGRANSGGDEGNGIDIVLESPPLKKPKPNDDGMTSPAATKSLEEIVQTIFTTNEAYRGGPKEVHDIASGSSSSNDIDTPTVTVPTYSKETQEKLNGLRKSLSIQVAPVRSYVYRTLGITHTTPTTKSDNGPPVTLEEYMDKLRTWHQSLLFVNPMDDTGRSGSSSTSNHIANTSDRWTVPLPPGIQNLGATCYLNTQLQCLAQNPAFLKGIFSWRNHQLKNNPNNANKDDKTTTTGTNRKNVMNSVMSQLQLLLAKMVLGGDGTVSTIDFSNALGLEHDEQQDPNEFARLLFERMDESFQECAAASASTSNSEKNNNSNDLSNLLNRIFHGVTTYETTCMTCNCTSERSEGFMDVNLPIVKPPTASTSKKNDGSDSSKASSKEDGKSSSSAGGRQTTLDSLCFIGPTKAGSTSNNKNVDTDLQYCLDQYMFPECLEDDNQYWCSACNGKRDAKRVPKFTELPPVLNVQLSRYVFDRKKFVKQKLSDKVLLPTVLKVPKGGSANGVNASGSNNEKKTKPKYSRYLLCAVMRHQGTSAYRGHYVAEAMDWHTGQWFEFNDETVKLLPGGPSCSYDPSILEDDGDTGNSSSSSQDEKRSSLLSCISGSQDAYNMYYVQDSFLAKNARSSLLQTESLCTALTQKHNAQAPAEVVETTEDDALLSVLKQRDMNYSMLSEQCFADWQTSDRLRRRRDGIRSVMFVDAGSLATIPLNNDGIIATSNTNVKMELPVWVDGAPLRLFLCCGGELDTRLHAKGPLLRHKHLLCEHGGLHPRVARRGKLLPRSIYDAYLCLLKGERTLLRQQQGDPSIGVMQDEGNDCLITPEAHLFCQDCSQSYRMELAQKLEFVRNLKSLHGYLDPKLEDFSLEYDEEEREQFSCPEDGFAYAIGKQFITKFRRQIAGMIRTVVGLEDGTTLSFADEEVGRGAIPEGLDAIDIQLFTPAANFVGPMGPNATSSSEQDRLDDRVNSGITCPHGNCNVLKNKRQVRYISWGVWSTLQKIFPHAIEIKRRRSHIQEDDVSDTADEVGCVLCAREKEAFLRMKSRIQDWADATERNPELANIWSPDAHSSREEEVHNFTNTHAGCRLVHIADIKVFRKTVDALGKKIHQIDVADCAALKTHAEDLAFPNTHRVVLEFERQPVERLLASLRSLICQEHHLVIRSAVFQDSPSSSEEEPSQRKQLSRNIIVLSDSEYREYISSLAELLRVLNDEDGGLAMGSSRSPVVIDDGKKEPKYLQDVKHVAESYHPAIRLCNVEPNDAAPDELAFTLNTGDKVYLLSPRVCNCETCRKEFAPLLEPDKESDENLQNISGGSSSKNQASSRGSAAADPILVESDLEEPLPDTFDLRVYEVTPAYEFEDVVNSLRDIQALPDNENEPPGESIFLRRSSRKRKTRFPAGPLLREDTVRIGLHHNIAALRLLLYEKCEIPVSGYFLILVASLDDNAPPKTSEILFGGDRRSLGELVDEMKEQSGFTDPFDAAKGLFLLYVKDEGGRGADISGLNESVMDSLLEISNIGGSSGKAGDSDGKAKRNRPAERGFRGTLLQSSSSPVLKEGPAQPEIEVAKDVGGLIDASAVSDEEKAETLGVVVDDTPKKQPAILMSDESSDDDESRTRSPVSDFKSESAQNHRREEVKVDTHMIEENDDLSSEEDDTSRQKAGYPSPISNVESPMADSSTQSLSQFHTDELVCQLMDIVGTSDESRCLDAILWAIRHNSFGSPDQDILDSAYAKFLEGGD